MEKYINFKELYKGIMVIIAYFILPFLLVVPLTGLIIIFHIESYEIVLQILLYLMLALIFISIYKKDIKKDSKDMKKNGKKHMKIALNYWLKGLFVMYASTFLIALFNITENTNQQENLNLLEQLPVLEFVLACFFAPIIEELVFRKALRKGIVNNTLYALTTGLIFGFLHVFTSIQANGISTLLYLIPYSSLGIAFGYTYVKTNNIIPSMIMHSLHNFMALLLACLGGLL